MSGTRSIALVILGLLVVSNPAGAQVNLVWDGCGTAGVQNRNFACDTNTGAFHLIGSFRAPAGVTQFVAMEAVVDLCSMETTLPSWWMYYNPGTCRETSLSASALPPALSGECLDPWKAQALGGVASYQIFTTDWNSARMIVAFALPQGTSQALTAGEEYFAFDARIDAQHTTGALPCPGCTAGTCIILNQVNLYQPVGVGDFQLPNADRSQHVMWQGGVTDCPFIVAARPTTWGRLKGMYR